MFFLKKEKSGFVFKKVSLKFKNKNPYFCPVNFHYSQK